MTITATPPRRLPPDAHPSVHETPGTLPHQAQHPAAAPNLPSRHPYPTGRLLTPRHPLRPDCLGPAPHTAVLGTGEITHITQDEVLSVLWKYRSVLASPAVWLPPLPFPEGRFQPYRARGGACLASSLQQAQELICPDAARLRCPSQDVFFRDSQGTLTSLLREGLRTQGVQVWRTKTPEETSPQ